MNILIIGGTRFIGRAIVHKLISLGHRLTLLHRGEHPSELSSQEAEVILWDRAYFPELPTPLKGRAFDAAVDTRALKAGDVSRALQAFAGRLGRYVLLSSVDVYRAFSTLLRKGSPTEPVPILESAPLREERFLFRNQIPERKEYEKLDCEEEARAHPDSVILRLPFVYGPHDYQRREWFFIRRILRRRPVVLGGASTWLGTRSFVGDVASAVALALVHPAASGESFVLGEPQCPTLEQLAFQIGEVMGQKTEVITLPDPLLPPHLKDYGLRPQHMLFSSGKIRRLLGFKEGQSSAESLRETVNWHLQHPPEEDEEEILKEERAEDEALARHAAGEQRG